MVLSQSEYPGECLVEGRTVIGGSLERVAGDLESLPAGYVAPTGGTKSRRGSAIVITYPPTNESCIRFVRFDTLAVGIRTGSASTSALQESACTVDDLVVDLLLSLAGKNLGLRPLATPTIATIDLCRTLDSAEVARLLGASDVRSGSILAGASCRWVAGDYELVARSSFTDSLGKILGDTITTAGHTLEYDENNQSSSGCGYSSPQGKIEATRSQEFIDVDVLPHSGTAPSKTLCAIARSAAVAILGNAGLE